MSFSEGFERFYRGWTDKAARITDSTRDNCFDKFFTLFVIYNRLYAEATYYLAREDKIELSETDFFPDTKAAKVYVGTFLDEQNILDAFENDSDTKEALEELVAILQEQRFAVSLKLPYARHDAKRDRKLLENLQSTDPVTRARAILQYIHCVRCNTFHGSKNYDRFQEEALRPVITLIMKLNSMLYEKLQSAPETHPPQRTTWHLATGEDVAEDHR